MLTTMISLAAAGLVSFALAFSPTAHASLAQRAVVAPLSQEADGAAATSSSVRVDAHGPTMRSSFTFAKKGDGTRNVELEVRDGTVTRIEVDGKSVPIERARQTADGWEIVDADGAVVERVTMPDVRTAPRAALRDARMAEANARSRALLAQTVAGQSADAMRMRGRAELALGHSRDASLQTPPKVMIGAGLGRVDAPLAHHLGADPERSTMLTSVVDGLPAQNAGLAQFDVLVSLNGSPDASPGALRKLLQTLEPDATVLVGYRRGAELRETSMKVAAYSGERLASIEVAGSPLFQGVVVGDTLMDVVVEDDGSTWQFYGPDGEARELRVEGVDGTRMFFFDPDGRRREYRVPSVPATGEIQMERLMRELDVRLEREFGERREGRPVHPREAADDDRIRRLEEQMERLMRELERANAREQRRSPGA